MAAIRKGLDAKVTGWTDNTTFIEVGNNAAVLSMSPSQSSQQQDTTPLSPANGYAQVRHGLRSWGGVFVSRLDPNIQGVGNGSITWTTYSTSIRSWRLTIEADPIDTTDLDATGRWTTSKPGLVRAFGVIEAFIDDGASVDVPLVGATDGAEAEVTLQLLASNTLAGDASIFDVNYEITPQGESVMQLAVVFTGAVTAVGTSSFFPAGIVTPNADPSGDTITLTHDTSGTKNVEGDAWWNRATVNVPWNEPITCEVSFVGTGALAST